MKHKFKLIILLLALLSNTIFGQQNVPLFDVQNQKYENSLEKFYQTRSVIRTLTPQVLEDKIDGKEYIVGPGDQFKINIFGELENEFEFTVLPEGNVILPTVGDFQVSGKTLKEVQETIKEKAYQFYINAKISVNLTGLRKFRVYLTGEVKLPGTYFAQGSDRLSDILEVSSVFEHTTLTEVEYKTGLNDWADDTKIEIIHKDGTTDVFDLTKFYRNGDKSHNPYLNGGDVIFVPSIDLTDSYVIIEGNVGFQGIHTLKKNEKMFEFLRRVTALSKKSNLENIILIRDGDRQVVDLLNEQEKYEKYVLKNRDKLIIPSLYDRVYIQGEVFTPGALPYLANYLAKDYVGKAGMLDTAVEIDNIVIIRQSDGQVLSGGDVIMEKGDTIIVPKRSREIFKDYMTIFAPIVSLTIAIIALVIK